MSQPESPFADQPWAKLMLAQPRVFEEDDIAIRTHMGQNEVALRVKGLPQRLRMLLMLVDGRRTVGTFRSTMTNFRSLDEALDMLIKMGLIELIVMD
jgi:hypothetical protein